jgi:hypothetical protein
MRKILVVAGILITLFVLFVAVFITPSMAADQERNRVDRVNRTAYATTPQQLAAETSSVRCRKWYSRARTVNARGEFLFVQRIVADGCYSVYRFPSGTSFTYQHSTGNQFWNLWSFDKTEFLVKGSGINPNNVEYRYRRWHTGWKSCWEFCFMDWRMWVSLTVRANGSYSNDKGEG